MVLLCFIQLQSDLQDGPILLYNTHLKNMLQVLLQLCEKNKNFLKSSEMTYAHILGDFKSHRVSIQHGLQHGSGHGRILIETATYYFHENSYFVHVIFFTCTISLYTKSLHSLIRFL